MSESDQSLTHTLGVPAHAHGDPPSRAPIRVLSTLVANQIAAGEVVERPASVVKELVENALDAGASRIQVELEQGGIELVRVSDDGCGIAPAELALAVAPHATSKIKDASDLDHIATLGFRGEALASIASVSRLTMRSRVREGDGHTSSGGSSGGAETPGGASELRVEGSVVEPVRPAAGPVGTSVSVRNLFFNTPARRKFLRTVQTEKERCADVVTHLALAHPSVGFSLSVDGKVTLDVPAAQGPRERALDVLGRELLPQLIDVHADRFDDARGVSLWGLAGLPSLARGSVKGQFVFVNGRSVRDRTIQHAVSEAYRGLIEPGRYPTVLLMLELSPQGVDVNVHPQKAEVRFRDGSMVHSVVLRALREALQRADLTPRATELRPGLVPGGKSDIVWSPGAFHPGSAGGLLGAGSLALTFEDARQPGQAGVSAAKFASYFSRFRPGQEQLSISLAQADLAGRAMEPPSPGDATRTPNEPETSPLNAAESSSLRATSLLQVHNSYVITQDEQGVVIIDQHALHERAMFEYLLQRVSAGPLESQRLLTPIPVPLTGAGVEVLASMQPLLARIGVEASAVSASSALVHAFPSFLFERNVDALDFMEELLRKGEAGEVPAGAASGEGPAFEHALRDVLDMMSCKAAIKAGDRLSDLELSELVRLREDVERSSNCPHGRPTSIRLTIRELEKLFGRS